MAEVLTEFPELTTVVDVSAKFISAIRLFRSHK